MKKFSFDDVQCEEITNELGILASTAIRHWVLVDAYDGEGCFLEGETEYWIILPTDKYSCGITLLWDDENEGFIIVDSSIMKYDVEIPMYRLISEYRCRALTTEEEFQSFIRTAARYAQTAQRTMNGIVRKSAATLNI